jgi:hypothetical protein
MTPNAASVTLMRQTVGVLKKAELLRAISSEDLQSDLFTALFNVKERIRRSNPTQAYLFNDIKKSLTLCNQYNADLIASEAMGDIYSFFGGQFSNGHF